MGLHGTTPDWNLIDQMGTEWVYLIKRTGGEWIRAEVDRSGFGNDVRGSE